jgi:hypothetical protein
VAFSEIRIVTFVAGIFVSVALNETVALDVTVTEDDNVTRGVMVWVAVGSSEAEALTCTDDDRVVDVLRLRVGLFPRDAVVLRAALDVRVPWDFDTARDFEGDMD